jgi:hypothetical protein
VTGILTGYEKESVAEVGAVLDDSPATADEVYLRTMGQSERAIAAVAAKRAGGGGGGGVLSVASVKLTNAQVLALPTTPVQLVAAPGAGKVLIPFLAVFYLDWTADYTNIDAHAVLKVGYSPTGSLTFLVAFVEIANSGVSGVLAEGASNYAVLGPTAIANGASSFVVAVSGSNDEPGQTNVALLLAATNALAGNFTGGDPANTLQVSVYYNTLTLL